VLCAPAAGHSQQPRRHARPDPVLSEALSHGRGQGPVTACRTTNCAGWSFCQQHGLPVAVCHVRWRRGVSSAWRCVPCASSVPRWATSTCASPRRPPPRRASRAIAVVAGVLAGYEPK
jgi:hypothetical protein